MRSAEFLNYEILSASTQDYMKKWDFPVTQRQTLVACGTRMLLELISAIGQDFLAHCRMP